MKNKKRTIILLMSAVMILICITPSFVVYAKEQNIDFIRINYNANCTITNAEGEYFTYKDRKFTGTMPIAGFTPPAAGSQTISVRVYSSTSYTYTNHSKKDILFSVLGSYTSGIIEAKNCQSATIATYDDVRRLTVEGKNIQYIIDTVAINNGRNGISIQGKADSKVEVKDTKEGIRITGAKGRCLLEVDDFKGKKNSIRNIAFVPYADEVIIKLPPRKPIQLIGAVKIHNRTKKRINSLHVLAIQNTTAFLTWHKVKGAKGYDVYRYDPDRKDYRKIETRKGKSVNYAFDQGLEKGKACKYRVQAYQHNKKGKKVYLKRSYWVQTIVGSDTMGNAQKVNLNKKGTIKKKAGKTLKLKATVTTQAGKTLYSNEVRWYTSNKKVATVDKNGKIKFKKKGKCFIWAKTHNGWNSKPLKIIVP